MVSVVELYQHSLCSSHLAMVTVPLAVAVIVTVLRPPHQGPSSGPSTASSRCWRAKPGIFHGKASAENANRHHIATTCFSLVAMLDGQYAEIDSLQVSDMSLPQRRAFAYICSTSNPSVCTLATLLCGTLRLVPVYWQCKNEHSSTLRWVALTLRRKAPVGSQRGARIPQRSKFRRT